MDGLTKDLIFGKFGMLSPKFGAFIGIHQFGVRIVVLFGV